MGEKMDGNYSVYKHTTPSGKVYIGLTGNDPKERWDCGHGYKGNPHFWNAIKLYGWKNIKHEVLYSNLTKEEAGKLEKELIAKYDSQNPEKGYNILDGGTFGYTFTHTEDAKKKISERSLKRWANELEHKLMSKRMSGENNPFYRKQHSEEARSKISEFNKNRFTEEARKEVGERLGGYWRGKIRNPESVNKSAMSKWKPVNQYTKDGEFIKTWNSAKEACDTLHIHKSTVCQCCKGIKPSAGGYIWRYADTQETG